MRFLNKIVFINSASVAYAEIELDGNVHLIGTQGVGKSTLLRAILFFYNANKVKLGIPREKKNYDDYYFPYQNSYVIYEVMKDGVPFCVLSYKVNGKVAFRFFDSGYKQELFIDDQNRAFTSWEQVRHAFGKSIYYTPLISSYEEYRRIIYGDNKTLKPEFRKYAIIESRQYENIPRTIQNVFLNSNLEAKFIKDTIINSLNEEEFSIDLENYSKNHLRQFESQINDIAIWSKTNRKGEVAIRKLADNIINHYRHYNYLNREKAELFRQLLLRMEDIEHRKPLLQVEISEENQKRDQFLKELENLKDLHRKREQKIISEIDYLKKQIDLAQKKQQEYERNGIDQLIAKVVQKESLNQEKEALAKEQTLLTSRFADIRTKYENLIQQIVNEKQVFVNTKTAEINQLEQGFGISKMELFTNYQKLIEDIKRNSEEEKTKAEETIETFKNEKHRLENQKSELRYQVFFEDKIKEHTEAQDDLKAKIAASKTSITNAQQQIKNVRKERELDEEKVNTKFDTEAAKAIAEKTAVEKAISDIELKIQQSENSFYGWLNSNVPGWENTIGKVVDEKVLFTSDLEPQQLGGKTPSIFGVQINLNALENKIKSIREYQQEIDRLKEKVAQIQKHFTAIETEKTAEKNKLKSHFNKRIKTLNDLIAQEEYQVNQNEEKQKINTVQLREWNEKSAEEKKNRAQDLEKKLEENAHLLSKAVDELIAVKKNISRRISLKETERDKKTADLEAYKNEKVSNIETSIKHHQAQSDIRIEEIQKNQMDELEDKGADTKRLEEVNGKLAAITTSLRFIADNEKTVIEYQKDKRELFDLLPQWKTDRGLREKQQAQMEEMHKQERFKAQEKLSHQTEKVKSLEEEFAIFKTDISEFEKFQKSEAFASMEETSEATILDDNQKISKKASDLISKITEKHYKGKDRFQDLQRAINVFVSNFNEENVFQFKVHFPDDQDYLDFGINLKEFIEEDKIQEYEKRVNERFGSIINQIGRETTELISKEAEIEKTIKKINDDFLHKNFVEAIKEMEMRTQKSSNPIVTLLLEIKDFNEAHSLELGQVNLFSTSESSSKNHRAVELVKQLIKELERAKTSTLTLSESFDLQFRIVENDNDSGWVEKLSNVGSEGTDVLVKAMINILLLNVFKDSASRKIKDFKLHCMMDEIGRLHPNNVRGILKFANERNILLINGSPTSQNATDYKYTYKLAKEQSPSNPKKYLTKINRLIKMNAKVLN